MSTTRTFVIVGGGVAAAEAAKTLHAEGYADDLLVVTGEPRPPYERPPLTKEYLRGEAGDEKLVKQPASFYEDAGIELRTGVHAEALDVRGRSLALDTGEAVRFDRLLLATGSRALLPRLDGVDAPWVHVVRTAADADRLREAAGSSSSVVVAGGGWIGAETAASLRQMGLAVTLVIPGSEVLERHLGAELGRELSDLQERHGVRLVRSSRVSGLRETAGMREVVLDTGEILATDLAVLGLGAVPAHELAIAAGLATDDGVLVDERLRSSADVVFAAGDVASAWTPRYGDRVRSAHWDNARRQARTAARNMLGMAEAYDRVPYFYSDQYDLGMEILGRPDLGADQHLRRTDEGLVAVWTRDGVVVAGAHANVWDSKQVLDRLIAERAVIDPEMFRDPAVPLDAFVAEAAA
jgi:3-phenylpropionate/trans-cinnamate dioxygenase ferredoxin reductase subunit